MGMERTTLEWICRNPGKHRAPKRLAKNPGGNQLSFSALIVHRQPKPRNSTTGKISCITKRVPLAKAALPCCSRGSRGQIGSFSGQGKAHTWNPLKEHLGLGSASPLKPQCPPKQARPVPWQQPPRASLPWLQSTCTGNILIF